MQADRRTTSPIVRRRGFTAVELSIGMVITTLVAAAAAALTLAVSQGWSHTEEVAMAQVRMTRASQTVEQILRGARLIGRYRAGTIDDPAAAPAGVIVWRADSNDDGLVQFDELNVIEYDGARRALVLYVPEFPGGVAPVGANPTFDDLSFISAVTAIEDFKDSIYSADVSLTPEVEVSGACFNVVAANNKGSRPSFEFTLQFTVAGQTTMQYGTATLRSPLP